jgi:2-oxoglutarate ferredoxin oxidoreductase subunit alpha
MAEVLSWKIGGDQGEGIDSTGDVLATVANRLGYHVYGYKYFSSRIKGGHTSYKVRIAARPLRSPSSDCHVLVALNQESINLELPEMVAGGIVIADSQFSPVLPEGDARGLRLAAVPLTAIAKAAGGVLYRNMAAVGATAALLSLPLEAFESYVADKFGRKGAQVVAQNLAALRDAHAQAQASLAGGAAFSLPQAAGSTGRVVMTGNDAVALGALAAGCRIMAGYPITPATDVMEALVKWFPRFGGVVVQTEDELAAISLVMGAAYGGARAMTASAGPGISLMQEGLGLAAAAELPVVVVDCQRAGPSTGMPTKTEQSDLLALTFGGHGEAPRIVLTPGTVEEAFADGFEAFNLAERYQTPVIIASDLGLGEWKVSVDPADLGLDRLTVDRGEIARPEDLATASAEGFARYAVTASGVSPRSLPGQKGGQYLATGVEHGRTGKVSENPENRVVMMQKRLRKLAALAAAGGGVAASGPAGPVDLALVGLGSTVGALEEAARSLAGDGMTVRLVRLRRIAPFPRDDLERALDGARRVLLVEQNATGQVEAFMRLAGMKAPSRSLRKFDGTLLLPEEVTAAATALMFEEAVS